MRWGIFRWSAAAAISLGLMVPASALASGPMFSAGPSSSVSSSNSLSYVYGMVSNDFNGDGSADIATTNGDEGTVTVMLGDSTGHFAPAPGSPITLSQGLTAITSDEFGRDTTPDLAVANQADDTVTILTGNGDGSFTQGTQIFLGCQPMGIATGDFNGDLVKDIAVAEGCGQVQIFLGDSSGGFTEAPGGPIPLAAAPGCTSPGGSAIVAGQFVPSSTNVDLAVLEPTTDSVDVLLGNGHGAFTHAAGSPFATGESGSNCAGGTAFFGASALTAGDFTGDGNQDDLAVGFTDGKASILTDNGDGTYSVASGSPTRIAPPNTQISSLATGYFGSGGQQGIAAGDYWQGGCGCILYDADWVSVALTSGSGQLTPAAGSPYEVDGVAGPVVAGSFAGGLGLQNGDDVVATDVGSCHGNAVVTLINQGAKGGSAPPANVYPGDGCQIPPPSATTGPVQNVGLTSATLTGTVGPGYGTPITGCEFEYGSGNFSSSAPCSPAPAEGSSPSVSANISGLVPERPYQYQLVVSDVAGTTTGGIVHFTTCDATSVSVPSNPDMDIAGCFTKGDHGTWNATSPVRVNGIEFSPDPGSTVTVDPGAPALRATGTGTVLLGNKVPVWKWAAVTGGLNVPLAGTITLADNTHNNLFGLPIVGTLKATFAKNEADITGSVNLRVLGDDVNASLTAITDNKSGFAGLTAALKGAGEAPGYNELSSCSPKKPPPVGFQCASVTNEKGNSYWGLVPSEPAVFRLGPLGINDLELSYDDAQQQWSGQGEVEIGDVLPGPEVVSKIFPTLGVGVQVGTNPLQLNGLSFSDSDLNLHLGPATITEVSFHVKLHPEFGIGGSLGLTTDGGIGIDGGFDYEQGKSSGFEIKLDGTVSVKTVTISGFVSYDGRDGADKVTLGGTFTRDFGPVSASLSLAGGVEPHHFELDGSGSIGAFGANVGGNGVLSDAGVGACGHFSVLFFSGDVGFKHFWSGETDFDGCDFSGLQTVGVGSALDAAMGTRTIHVPRGLGREEFAAVGANGPPAVTLRGPGGETLSTPARPDRITVTKDGFALAVTSSKTTYFIVTHPHAGRWTIGPEPGAAAPIRYETARPLVPLHLRARVSGSGRKRTLRWSFTSQPGVSVRFFQTGGTQQTIAQSARGRGASRFAVAAGLGGTRHVVALVSIDGFPRQVITVARFTAPAPALPRIAGASYRVVRGTLRVSWSRVPHASSYDLSLRLSDGTTPEYRIPGTAKGAAITLPAGTTPRKVTIVVTANGARSRPVVARSGTQPKRHKRKRKRKR